MGFDDDDYDKPDPALPGLALAIGSLCQAWSELEYAALLLLSALMGNPMGTQGSERLLTILRCFDFRDQLSAIKVAAVMGAKDHTVADAIIEAVDHIDNTLRPRRNRLVHDRWEETGDPITAHRITHMPKVSRPQAFQPRTISGQQTSPETMLSVQTTTQEISAYTNHIFCAAIAVIQPTESALEELRATQPPRPFPPLQWGTPSQPDNSI